MSTFMTTHPPKPEFGIRNSEFGITAHPPGLISDFGFRSSDVPPAHPAGETDAPQSTRGFLWCGRPARTLGGNEMRGRDGHATIAPLVVQASRLHTNKWQSRRDWRCGLETLQRWRKA